MTSPDGAAPDEVTEAVIRRKESILTLLHDLVREPSVAGSPAIERCHDIVTGHISELGISPSRLRFDGLPVTFARFGSVDPPIMFAGHLDVVPALGAWSYPAFDLTVEHDRLYGRGVVDMKAGVAAFIGALHVLSDLGALDDVGIELVLTSDEEVGSARGMIPFLGAGLTVATGAVCAEPTNLAVFHGNRGVVWLALRVRGQGGHAGQTHLLSNPVPVAAQVVAALNGLQLPATDPHFDPPTPSIAVTRLHADTDATNVVADTVEIAIDRRLLPGEIPRDAVSEIETLARQLVQPPFELELSIEREWPPYLIDRSELIASNAMTSLEDSGIAPRLGTDQAANDSSWLCGAGIPPILLGPGEPGLAHVTDESLPTEQLYQATEVFARVALRWPERQRRRTAH